MKQRIDWHLLVIALADGGSAEALGHWDSTDEWWRLDRKVKGRWAVFSSEIITATPVDLVVLPAPSGHVEGLVELEWQCGNVVFYGDNAAEAEIVASQMLQQAANSLAIAAHHQALPTPTITEDVKLVRDEVIGLLHDQAQGRAVGSALERIFDALEAPSAHRKP